MNTLTMIRTAEAQFGKVVAAVRNAEGEHILMITRDHPVFDDRPCMTIRGAEGCGFYWGHWGHYDLTVEQAHKELRERANQPAWMYCYS